MAVELEEFSYLKAIQSIKETYIDNDYEGYVYNLIALCTNWSSEELAFYNLIPSGQHPIHCEYVWSDLEEAPISFRAREFVVLTQLVDDLECECEKDDKDPFKIAFLSNDVLLWALGLSDNILESGQVRQPSGYVMKIIEERVKQKSISDRSKGGQARAKKYKSARIHARIVAQKLKSLDPSCTLDDIADHVINEIAKTPEKYGLEVGDIIKRSTIKQTWLTRL